MMDRTPLALPETTDMVCCSGRKELGSRKPSAELSGKAEKAMTIIASSLKESEKLDAINWAAKQNGQSYGQFVTTLTEAGRETVYREYARFLWEREEMRKRKMKERRGKNI